MNKKLLTSILIIIAFIGLIGAALWYGKNIKSQEEEVAKADWLENWPVFEDKEIGVSFQYPPNFGKPTVAYSDGKTGKHFDIRFSNLANLPGEYYFNGTTKDYISLQEEYAGYTDLVLKGVINKAELLSSINQNGAFRGDLVMYPIRATIHNEQGTFPGDEIGTWIYPVEFDSQDFNTVSVGPFIAAFPLKGNYGGFVMQYRGTDTSNFQVITRTVKILDK